MEKGPLLQARDALPRAAMEARQVRHRTPPRSDAALDVGVTHLARTHADFYLCSVSGFGSEPCRRKVEAALDSLAPDVVMVQLCATRMSLLTPNGWRVGGPGWLSKLVLRWYWTRVAERAVPRGACCSQNVHGVGSDFAWTVVAAADRDLRVVFGDRDIVRTAKRGWALLSLWQRVALLLELLTASVTPACLTSKWFGVRTEAQIRHAGSDAFAEILAHFARRYPPLAQQQEEHEQYMISSCYRLDKPAAALCTTVEQASASPEQPSGDRRGRVLVVLGHSFSRALEAKWGVAVDRHDLTHNAPSLWARAAVPLLVVLLLIALPLSYAAAHVAALNQGLADHLQSLSDRDPPTRSGRPLIVT